MLPLICNQDWVDGSQSSQRLWLWVMGLMGTLQDSKYIHKSIMPQKLPKHTYLSSKQSLWKLIMAKVHRVSISRTFFAPILSSSLMCSQYWMLHKLAQCLINGFHFTFYRKWSSILSLKHSLSLVEVHFMLWLQALLPLLLSKVLVFFSCLESSFSYTMPLWKRDMHRFVTWT